MDQMEGPIGSFYIPENVVLLCEGLTLPAAQMRESLFVHKMARTMICPYKDNDLSMRGQ